MKGHEFAKLRASRAFAPYVPSCLRAFAPYVPYAPSCLRVPHVFPIYVPSRLTHLRDLRALLTRLIYTAFSRAFRAFFEYVKTSIEQIFSPAKTYHFPRIIKGTTNCAVGQKPVIKLFKPGNFLSIFKT